MKLETRLDAESRGDKTVALLPYQEKHGKVVFLGA